MNHGPAGAMPWAATAAFSSWMPGPTTVRISERGMVSRMMAVVWASIVAMWGFLSIVISSRAKGAGCHVSDRARRTARGAPAPGGR